MKKLLFLAIGMFVVGCSSFMISGLLSEIAKSLEQTLPIVGQGITAFNLAYLISAPLWAFFNKIKSERNTIKFALLIIILGNLITIASNDLFLFLFGRIVVGIGAGIFTPSCVVLAMSLFESKGKGKALSFILGANSAGAVFGAPLGIYISSLGNWKTSILYIVILNIIALVGITFQRTKFPHHEKNRRLLSELQILTDPRVLSIFGVTCLTTAACIGLHSYITALQAGTSNSLASIFFVWGIGGFIGSSLIGHLVDRSGNSQLIMSLLLIGLITTFVFLPSLKGFSYFGLFPFFIWGALGWATTTPQQHSLFEINKEKGKILSSLNSSAMGFGSAVGTIGGGLLISNDVKALYLPYYASALLLIVLAFQVVSSFKFSRRVINE